MTAVLVVNFLHNKQTCRVTFVCIVVCLSVSSELLMSDEVTGACTGRNVVVIVCGCVLLQN